MKTISSIFLLLVMISGISTIQAQNKTAATGKAKVVVYYFHGTNRCATCMAIEDNTKKTLQTYFDKELKNGTIKFQVVDVDEKANEKLAEKYEASGSALFVTKLDKGKEVINDLTNFAFSYGRNNPEKFILGVKDEIAKNLK